MAVVGTNCVIDLYHGDGVTDFARVKAAGIIAVIHKASEGLGFKDPVYHARRDAARAAGLLWGCYHFSSGDDGTEQADYFLGAARPDGGDLVCLDVEPSSGGAADMNYDALAAFVHRISSKLGRLPLIYGGQSLLAPLMKGRTGSIVNRCALWYAEYPPAASTAPLHPLPDGWSNWTLWQYAADGKGPMPHDVDGVARCDRDTFNGSRQSLMQQWPDLARVG